MSDKNIRSRTVRAAGWVLGLRLASQAISFGFGIALARLLVPDDFGLVAMALVFFRLASLFMDVGLGAALIQKKDVRKEHFSSVFWLNAFAGCILGLILFIAAPWLSVFYERAEIENICKALSLGFLLGSITLVPNTRLAKKLLFKYISFSNLVAVITSGIIAIILAAAGYGYWSLVGQLLSQQLVLTMLLWNFSGWRPKVKFSSDAIKELFSFSANVFLTGILQYIAANLDKLLLGKFLGGQILGIYDKAHSMMLFPMQNISSAVGGVMFSSFSIIQSDISRVRKIYLRSTRAIALVTFPMMAGMFVVADSFVLGVLGPQWSELIPVLRILTIAGLVRAITTVTGTLYKSQGAVALQLRINLVMIPIRIAGIVIGLLWGLIGVAIGFTIASYINSVITLTFAGRLIELRLISLMRSLAPVFIPTLLMAILVWLIRPLSGMQDELLIFIGQTIFGITIYLVSIILMDLRAYQDVKDVFLGEIKPKRKISM